MSDSPNILYFTAKWCGPCRAVRPIMEKIHEDGLAKVAIIDIDEHPDLTADFDVLSVPTFVRLDGNGEPETTVVGAAPRKELVRKLGL